MALSFTLTQFISLILGICGGISVIIVAITHISTVISKLKEPELKQNKRLEVLETKITEIENTLQQHCGEINQLKESNRVIHQALLALLSHGINGNSKADMIDAKKELQKYLTEVH